MGYVVEVIWTAKDGAEQTVLDALLELAPLTRAEPGCRAYHLYHDPDEPRVFRLCEVYDNEAALAAHTASEHFKRLALGKAIPLLETRARAFFQTIDV